MADEKMFTQEQVNQMISDRLAREKNTLEHYKAELAAEAAAKAEADAMKARFSAVMGDKREAVHPRLADLMLEDFKAAVNDPANEGKDDEHIFSDLFADKGYLKPVGASWIPSGQKLPRPGSASSDQIANAFGLKRG